MLLNLSSWTEARRSLPEWLVDELKFKYGIRKEYGRSLVSTRGLALLLDGLDELPADRQHACVEAINQFQREHRPRHLVVCCRTQEYRTVPPSSS